MRSDLILLASALRYDRRAPREGPMAELIFYTNPMSRGQIARWALHEAGADYQQVIVDWANKPQALLDANPMGKVPTIVHAGKTVSEAAAICAYLADAFPDAGLAPEGGERADYYRWLFFAAGPVEQAVTSRSMGFEPSEEQQGMAGFGSFDRTIDTLDAKFEHDDYVCGDRFTMADVYVGAQIDWGLAFKSMPERDSLAAYAARIRERDAYQAAKAIDNALIEEMRRGG